DDRRTVLLVGEVRRVQRVPQAVRLLADPQVPSVTEGIPVHVARDLLALLQLVAPNLAPVVVTLDILDDVQRDLRGVLRQLRRVHDRALRPAHDRLAGERARLHATDNLGHTLHQLHVVDVAPQEGDVDVPQVRAVRGCTNVAG